MGAGRIIQICIYRETLQRFYVERAIVIGSFRCKQNFVTKMAAAMSFDILKMFDGEIVENELGEEDLLRCKCTSRCKIKGESDAIAWLSSFKEVTKTEWIVTPGSRAATDSQYSRFTFKKDYICQQIAN